MIEACQWYKSSPTGPAEHDEGGSLGGVSRCTGGRKNGKKKNLGLAREEPERKMLQAQKRLLFGAGFRHLHSASGGKTKNEKRAIEKAEKKT